MVGGCCYPIVGHNRLHAVADRAAVSNKPYPVPYLVIKSYLLNFYLSAISQHERVSGQAMLFPRGGAQPASDALNEKYFTFRRPRHDYTTAIDVHARRHRAYAVDDLDLAALECADDARALIAIGIGVDIGRRDADRRELIVQKLRMPAVDRET